MAKPHTVLTTILPVPPWARVFTRKIRRDIMMRQEVLVVANIKSAKKRIRQTQVRTLRNKIRKTMVRSAVRRFEDALTRGDLTTAATALQFCYGRLDRAAQKGAIHHNTASRRKSRLSARLHKAEQSAS